MSQDYTVLHRVILRGGVSRWDGQIEWVARDVELRHYLFAPPGDDYAVVSVRSDRKPGVVVRYDGSLSECEEHLAQMLRSLGDAGWERVVTQADWVRFEEAARRATVSAARLTTKPG